MGKKKRVNVAGIHHQPSLFFLPLPLIPPPPPSSSSSTVPLFLLFHPSLSPSSLPVSSLSLLPIRPHLCLLPTPSPSLPPPRPSSPSSTSPVSLSIYLSLFPLPSLSLSPASLPTPRLFPLIFLSESQYNLVKGQVSSASDLFTLLVWSEFETQPAPHVVSSTKKPYPRRLILAGPRERTSERTNLLAIVPFELIYSGIGQRCLCISRFFPWCVMFAMCILYSKHILVCIVKSAVCTRPKNPPRKPNSSYNFPTSSTSSRLF